MIDVNLEMKARIIHVGIYSTIRMYPNLEWMMMKNFVRIVSAEKIRARRLINRL